MNKDCRKVDCLFLVSTIFNFGTNCYNEKYKYIIYSWRNKLLIILIISKLNDIIKEKKNDLWNCWINIIMFYPKIWLIYYNSHYNIILKYRSLSLSLINVVWITKIIMLQSSYHYREKIHDVLYYPICITRATRTTTTVINETESTILYSSIIIIIYHSNQQHNSK